MGSKHVRLHAATGAWMPGDPVGSRKFFEFSKDRPFMVESGGHLTNPVIAYETFGTLNADKSNAVLILHAWTGDSHVSGPAGDGHPTEGWWHAVVDRGGFVDTDKWFVVCPNVIGGCQGSTGPASVNPETGKPYGSSFPVITIRDMVRSQALLSDHLGIDKWHSVIGGSMGGMQVLEWAVMFPHRVASVAPIATCLQSTAQQIGWGHIGRIAIREDPNFNGGDYYEQEAGPDHGLAVARQIAQVTFRSDNLFSEKFGRNLQRGNTHPQGMAMWDRFEIESYLDHHGEVLVSRFDANSYLTIGKAMELHDIARGRGGLKNAVARIKCPTLAIGIETDMLYPDYQEKQIYNLLSDAGTSVDYVNIDTQHGHDGFLLESVQVGRALGAFLDRV